MGELSTPAKINPYLRICGQRSDGYHEIETVFLPLDAPRDRVSIKSNPEAKLTLSGNHPELPMDERNLAYRAANTFAKFANIEPHWHITLEKEIPIAAGLGGGSSDAAAVLRLLHEAYPDRISDKELATLAIALGADVPFFLKPLPALACGVGEDLTTIDAHKNIPVLLCNPGFPISTSWAYTNWQPDENASSLQDLLSAIANGDTEKIAANLRNDLAPAAFAKFPAIEILQDELLAAGACGVGLSGSGSSLFAIFNTESAQEDALNTMLAKFAESSEGEAGIRFWSTRLATEA